MGNSGLSVLLAMMMRAATTAAYVTRSLPQSGRSKHQFVRSLRQTHRTPASTANKEIEWTTDKVRSTFVDFFKENGHTFQPSSASAPLNDPTLLFTNAGMNQFKPLFLGQADPNSPMATLKRATNSQKCIRAGGKHNDLEDVGRDTYHHTFFEMLGSWSFGDYFKKEAIDFAWKLLTEVYKLDPDRIYATYFKGNDALEPDFEARELWRHYLPENRVIGCDEKDNFWEMGDVGPCGPCAEIHYDRIGGRDAAHLVNADNPNVIEIWNLVFIQFNREADGSLKLLPAKHIDTGLGLERLVSLLQDKTSNYDIDSFQAFFKAIEAQTTKGPYTGKIGADDTNLKDTAYRVLADHARTLAFAIADGAIPNNEGRGYVLRRILRRAARYGQQILECPPGIMEILMPVVVDTYGHFFPELKKQKDLIVEVVREEEAAFRSMLDRGIKYFSEVEQELKAAGTKEVSGKKAFYMYDTLGFPLDLTELMAEESGMSVDTAGFAQAMKMQRNRSREAQKAARAGGAPVLELQAEQTSFLKEDDINPTDDRFKYKWDVQLPATVMAVYNESGFLSSNQKAEIGNFVGLVLDKSSFYAEAGGQDADTGALDVLDDKENVVGRITVTDVQVYAGFVLHKGRVDQGSAAIGQHVMCKVDYERRRLVAPNHSMTHVLNAALRKVLGDNCDQRGSLCNDEKLRFDFSHKNAMTLDELKAVEAYCQEVVSAGAPVTSDVMPLADAKKIDGVRAVFGEVYPDPVRVISIGDGTSVEFCGGTHLGNMAEAEAFVLTEETAVAKGIRRVTAVTKDAAKQAQEEGRRFADEIAKAERIDPVEADKRVGSLRKDLDGAFVSAALKVELRGKIESIQKNANEIRKRKLQQRVDTVLNDVKQKVEAAKTDGQTSLVLNIDIGADSKASQLVMNTVKDLAPDIAFLGISEEVPGSGGKVLAFALVPDALVDGGLNADDWVRSTLESCGGRGGGKPGNAQGQTKECDDVSAVLQAAQSFVESKVTISS